MQLVHTPQGQAVPVVGRRAGKLLLIMEGVRICYYLQLVHTPQGQAVPVVGRRAGKTLLIMVVASVLAIVRLLLVMSGDVEENPGPLGQHTKGEGNMSLLKL